MQQNDLISRKAAHALVQGLKQYVWKSPIGTYHRVTVDIDDVQFGLDTLPAIEAEPKWIPVEERLPTVKDADKAGDVLVYCYSGYACVWDWDAVETHTNLIGYWMPLPQPPKGE